MSTKFTARYNWSYPDMILKSAQVPQEEQQFLFYYSLNNKIKIVGLIKIIIIII